MGRRGLGAGPIRWPEPTHTREPGTTCWRRCSAGGRRASASTGRCAGRSDLRPQAPLAPRTIQRIYAGAVRFGWPEPFLVVLRQHMAGRSIDLPMPTVAANGTHIGLATAGADPTRRARRGPLRGPARRAGADDRGRGGIGMPSRFDRRRAIHHRSAP
jgi:DNA (cytosine-5)-methyltransferase 1